MNNTPPPTGAPADTPAGTPAVRSAGLYPDAVEDLRQRTRDFIRGTVIPAEPRPGQALNLAVRRELSAAARAAGVFAPHVSVEFGGQGLAVEHWSPVFQEAGYSPIGAAVLNCMAPDEGNMHMLDLIGTPEQKRRFWHRWRPGTSARALPCQSRTPGPARTRQR